MSINWADPIHCIGVEFHTVTLLTHDLLDLGKNIDKIVDVVTTNTMLNLKYMLPCSTFITCSLSHYEDAPCSLAFGTGLKEIVVTYWIKSAICKQYLSVSRTFFLYRVVTLVASTPFLTLLVIR